MIEVAGVSHRFGSRPVLDEVSLRVESRSVVGLVGPNGAGKSTLLRLIATLIRPRSGSIRVDGLDVRERAPKVRQVVGYLPERDVPYGDLTSWEYLDLFGEIAGLAPERRRRRIDLALTEAGLSARRDELAGQLSKGLKQRLSLQSILLHAPRVLLLDEPTDGLDPQTRDLVCTQIRALATAGCAVLISSHVLEELERVADRTIALVNGRATELRAPPRRGWSLRLRGDLAVAKLVASGVPVVVRIALEGDALEVELQEGVPDPAEVTAALVQAGISVVGVAEQRVSLRQLYNQALEGATT